MLEILVLTIIFILAFVAVGWYALYRSRQQNREFLADLDQRMAEDSDNDFSAVFKQEMSEALLDNAIQDIDQEPIINFSTEANNRAKTALATQRDGDRDFPQEQQEGTPQQHKKAPLEHGDVVKPLINDWDMVIAFTIMAAEGKALNGLDLKTALSNLNFIFGDMQIYHRMISATTKKPLFSVANIMDPGTFDSNTIATMTTPGILIFAKLPGPINGLTLFDDILETAQILSDKLDGILCDEARQPITQSILESMRSRIFALNLSLQAEQNHNKNGYSD